MALAADGPAGDREYVLERTAAAVRSMDAVKWIADVTTDPVMAVRAKRYKLAL